MDNAEMEITVQKNCDALIQQLSEADARLAQDDEDDDAKYPEHRSELITMVKDLNRKRTQAMLQSVTTTKESLGRQRAYIALQDKHIALQAAHTETLKEYTDVLAGEVGIGLGCFVGGLLLGITLSIEPKWLFGRR